MKRHLLSLLLIAASLAAFAQTGIIVSTPKGTLYPTVYGSSEKSFLTAQGGFGSISQNCGYCTEMVIDGNDFYIHNIIRELPGIDSWVKGSKDNSGNVVFDFPQPVAVVPNTGETLYATMMVASTSASATNIVPDTENSKLRFSWDGTTLKQIRPGSSTGDFAHYDGMIGLTNAQGAFKAYGEAGVSYSIFSEKPLAPAQSLATTEYTASYNDAWNDPHKQVVKVAYDGNTAWIQGLCAEIPSAWVTGRVNEDKSITLNSKQYLGIAHDYFCYFYAADNSGLSAGQTYAWASDVTLAPASPSDLGTFTANRQMMINLGHTRPWFGTGMTAVTLKQIVKGDPIPCNPVFGEPEWDAKDAMGVADFFISTTDMHGNALDPSKIYYRVYFDHALATVAYSADGKPLTDVPFGKDFDLVMYMYDWHFVIFLDPLNSIGIQVVYKTDGKEYCSEIVTYNFPTTDVDNITSNPVVNTEYYAISGIRLAKPQGICIKRDVHADGSVSVSRVLVP